MKHSILELYSNVRNEAHAASFLISDAAARWGVDNAASEEEIVSDA